MWIKAVNKMLIVWVKLTCTLLSANILLLIKPLVDISYPLKIVDNVNKVEKTCAKDAIGVNKLSVF